MTAERGDDVRSIEQLTGELELRGRIMPASNATFLGQIGERTVVYKPVAGERPLWDFPEGTLAGREIAAYLVSEALGWNLVPTTVLRDGPHGPGMVQVWQEPVEDTAPVDIVAVGAAPSGFLHVFDGYDAHDHEVSLVHEDTPELRLLAVFDAIVNNADRKGGHVLAMPDGHRYGVDHGLTFHCDNKLRTVLWGWAGQRLTEREREGVRGIASALDSGSSDVAGGLARDLAEHLAAREIEAFADRCRRLLRQECLPVPGGEWPVIPWPPF